MSRSGYSDDYYDDYPGQLYREAVASAIRGRRGQSFLKEMLAAMDHLPEKKLIRGKLEKDGAVCAIGAVGVARKIDMTGLDPEDAEGVAAKFGIAESMAREIVYENDEAPYNETPEIRFDRMRRWVADNIFPEPLALSKPDGGK